VARTQKSCARARARKIKKRYTLGGCAPSAYAHVTRCFITRRGHVPSDDRDDYILSETIDAISCVFSRPRGCKNTTPTNTTHRRQTQGNSMRILRIYTYIYIYIYIYIYMCINKRSAIFHSGAFKKRKHFRSESSDVSISRILSRAIHSANISHSRESDVLFIKDRRNKRGIKKSDLIGAGVASPRDAREVRGGEYRSANRNRIET